MSFTAICGCGFPVVWINVDVAKRDIERVFVTLALIVRQQISFRCRIHHTQAALADARRSCGLRDQPSAVEFLISRL